MESNRAHAIQARNSAGTREEATNFNDIDIFVKLCLHDGLMDYWDQ